MWTLRAWLCLWCFAAIVGADAPGEERLVELLRGQVSTILDRHGGWSARHPLEALLKDHPPAVQVQALLPFIDHGAAADSASPAQPAVCERLGQLWEASWPRLVVALDDPKATRRAAAASAINQLSFKNQSKHHRPWANEVGPRLANLMTHDPSPVVRTEAARALASLKEQAAPYSDAVLQAMDDPDPAVQRMAMSVLMKAGPDGWRAIPRLIAILNDPTNDQHDDAAEALQIMGYAGRDAVPALLTVCGDPSATDDHIDASNALFWIGTRGLQPVPYDLLARAVRHCRYAAPAWLAHHFAPDDVALAVSLAEAIEAVNEHDYKNGEWAARALGRIKPRQPEVAAYLRVLAESDHTHARAWAAVAYGGVTGDDATAAALLQRIYERAGKKEREECVIHAAGVLGPAAAPMLAHIQPELKSDSAWASLNHIHAYYRLRGQPDQYLDFVAELMRSRTANDMPEQAGEILRELGPLADAQTPTLIEVLDDYSPWAQDNRFHAAYALRHIGPTAHTRRALPGLARMLDPAIEDSPYNRRMAAEAIWSISRDATTAVNGVLGTLDDRGRSFIWAMWALKEMGPAASAAIPRLRETLADPNPCFRELAAEALEAIESPLPAGSVNALQLSQWHDQLADDQDATAVAAVWRLAQAGEPARAWLKQHADHAAVEPGDDPRPSLRANRQQARVIQALSLMDHLKSQSAEAQ